MIAKTTEMGLFADTQNNPTSDNVAKLMNIHQHLIILTVKHILNIKGNPYRK